MNILRLFAPLLKFYGLCIIFGGIAGGGIVISYLYFSGMLQDGSYLTVLGSEATMEDAVALIKDFSNTFLPHLPFAFAIDKIVASPKNAFSILFSDFWLLYRSIVCLCVARAFAYLLSRFIRVMNDMISGTSANLAFFIARAMFAICSYQLSIIVLDGINRHFVGNSLYAAYTVLFIASVTLRPILLIFGKHIVKKKLLQFITVRFLNEITVGLIGCVTVYFFFTELPHAYGTLNFGLFWLLLVIFGVTVALDKDRTPTESEEIIKRLKSNEKTS